MKNRITQVLLSLALLALLIQIVLIAPGQIRDGESKAAIMPIPEAAKTSDRTDQSMKDMHMIETEEGRKEWELWAQQAGSITAKDLLELSQVKAVFFSDTGVTFTVTGNKGTVQTKTKDLRVEGNVVTKTSNGYTFRTEVVEYVASSKSLSSVHPVEMVGPPDARGLAMKLTGIGMKASMADNLMDILADVKAEKGLDASGRKAFIRSHTASFSGVDRTADFRGDVVVDMDSMRITGPQAKFLYDGKKDLMKSVLFSGGARVSDSEKWATSQTLAVDFEENKFVFKGNPRVVQNNDELRGEVITFLNGGKQVEVSRARARVDEKRMDGGNQ